MAIMEGQVLLIEDVVQRLVIGVVVDAHALLLNEGVVAGGVHLETGAQGDGPQGAVGRQRDVIGLRHGGDLFHLCDAAGMGQVGLG